MKSVRLDKLSDFTGQRVLVRGWAHNARSSGSLVFVQLRDGYGWSQAIVERDKVPADAWERAVSVTPESSVSVSGIVAKHPHQEAYELHIDGFEVIQRAEEYPISKKEHGIDFLMDHRHLWLRSRRQWAIQRVRNSIILGIYEFMGVEGFIKVDSPILTPTACEGTTELFEINYFDEKAYLSQSGQLYIEAAIFAHNKVFDFGPTFRAEQSKTRRHLTEFWMMDSEMAFATHDDNVAVQEKLVEHLVQRVLKRNREELTVLERDTATLEKVRAPFIRKTHYEAVAQLRKLGSDIKDGEDLGGDDESLLTKSYDKPIFIERYPAAIKAFYMKRDSKDDTLALCNDLLAPEGYGEIIGGSAREDDYEILRRRIAEHKLPEAEFQWYLDLRKYGSVPHAGFGLGLERMVSWVCGLAHIREAIPFPRTISRLRP